MRNHDRRFRRNTVAALAPRLLLAGLLGCGAMRVWVGNSHAQTGSMSYGLIMAIAGAPDSCTDANSRPEPYGIVERKDSRIWGQIKTLAGKINAISRELKPIISRLRKLEAAEKPLAEDATAELSSLQVERANLEERLVPLREERAHLLRKVRLVTLRRQYRELPVYAGDEIEVRLMERDIFADDLCGTWTVRLDRAVLEKGFLKLGSPQRTYVILAFAPR